MIEKIESLNKILDNGVVAVVRAENEEQAVKISRACMDGGIYCIEVTFTVPNADKVINVLNKDFSKEGLLVGAGTVLDSETARIAMLAGAKFIVSPSFNEETAKLCNRYQIPYMAGCMTITEIITALEAGVDIIKLFPGSAFGPTMIKDIKAPLPQVPIMPTGGVSLDNVAEWIKNGAFAVGVGGSLMEGAKTGNYVSITEKARKFVEKVKAARN